MSLRLSPSALNTANNAALARRNNSPAAEEDTYQSGGATSADARGTNAGGSAKLTVDGNTVSWSDDGWYEVQSVTSRNTMSEGGSSATLPSGEYTVINHTTGERHESVLVGATSKESDKNEANETEGSRPITTTVVTVGPNNTLNLSTLTVTPDTDWETTLVEAGQAGFNAFNYATPTSPRPLIPAGASLIATTDTTIEPLGTVNSPLGGVFDPVISLALTIGNWYSSFNPFGSSSEPAAPTPDPEPLAPLPATSQAASGSGMGPDGAYPDPVAPPSEAASGSGMGPDGATPTSGGSGTTDSANSPGTSTGHQTAPSGSGMGPDGATSNSGGSGTTDSASNTGTSTGHQTAPSGSGMGPDGATSGSGSTQSRPTSGGSGTTDSAESSGSSGSQGSTGSQTAASGSGMGPDGAT